MILDPLFGGALALNSLTIIEIGQDHFLQRRKGQQLAALITVLVTQLAGPSHCQSFEI